VPFVQIVAEAVGEAFLHARVDEAPRGAGKSGVGVEKCLGAAVVGLVEAVDTVEGDRYRVDGYVTAECGGEPFDGGVAAAFGVEHLGGVLLEPEPSKLCGVAGEDRDGAACDPTYLGEAGFQVGPLVDAERGHGRVEGLVREGELLGCGVHRLG
jgi:hypothetical protein